MPGLSHPQSPIEVLHIASGDRWAGAEVQLWTLVRHLNRREDTRARVVLLNEGETAERLREAGVAVDILDESRLNGFQILLGLRRLIRLHRPDVIHTHRQKENIIGSFANATTLRVPCVRTVHGAPEHTPPLSRPHKRIFRWLDWIAGRYIQSRIIAVTDELGRQLSREFPPSHVIAIENGVDVEAIRGAHDFGAADFRTALPQHRHIGIVGRLEPVKRIDIFLDMAADLVAGTPPWPLAFHVFGDGSLLTQLRKHARRLQIYPYVTFHGHRTDIHTCIASLDIMIMCSDHEGMPMAALEALALGVPVIANRTGGLIGAMDGGDAGILLTSRTGASYADAVRELLSSPQRAQSMAETARRHIAGHLSAARNAERIAEIYRTLQHRAV
jgi:L-malate glycosyltransferase